MERVWWINQQDDSAISSIHHWVFRTRPVWCRNLFIFNYVIVDIWSTGYNVWNHMSRQYILRKVTPVWHIHCENASKLVHMLRSPSSDCDRTNTKAYQRRAVYTMIARFMGPTWGPSGADRTQVGPRLAPWTLLSGYIIYDGKTGSISAIFSSNGEQIATGREWNGHLTSSWLFMYWRHD